MRYEGEEITQEEWSAGRELLWSAFCSRFLAFVKGGVISYLTPVGSWFNYKRFGPHSPLVNGEQLDISPDDRRPVAFAFKSLQDPQNSKLLPL